MTSQTYTIVNPTGFHVRPIKDFVKQASAFPCKIFVTSKGKRVNGKSSLSMLTLGIAQNEEVLLETEGEQEEEAQAALGKLLTEIHE